MMAITSSPASTRVRVSGRGQAGNIDIWQPRKPEIEAILKSAEEVTGLGRKEFCNNSKSRSVVMIKEAIIVMGYENGIRIRVMGQALGVDASAVSKRREVARRRAAGSEEMTKLLKAMRTGVK